MQKPEPHLPYGTEPVAPRSDGKTYLVFSYIWQKDVAKIPKVPGVPRSVNPARAIAYWLVGRFIYYTIFQ